MASLLKKQSGFYAQFYWLGRRESVAIGSLQECTKGKAKEKAGRVGSIIRSLKKGEAAIPEGIHVTDFVIAEIAENKPDQPKPARTATASLRSLAEAYEITLGNGTIEASSLLTVQIHLRWLRKELGDGFGVGQLTLDDLQGYVNKRSQKKYRGRTLSPVTIRKEVATFRALWNWAAQSGKVQGAFPSKGLRYPKGTEKLPFMNLAEIERRISDKMPTAAKADLWESLYLTAAEVAEFLKFVEERGGQPWLLPLVTMAAHAGMRRSELMRVEIADVNFADNSILVRELKRDKSRRTTRRVAMSQLLARTLKSWLDIRAGAPSGKLFVQFDVHKSKTKRKTPTPLTRGEIHDHFKRLVDGSKWAMLRGLHVLRHSFISALAAKGVDQRVIDDMVGHSTDEQRKRYRHIYPDKKSTAIELAFGVDD